MFLPRLEILHVLIVPVALAVLMSMHLASSCATAPLAVPRAGAHAAQRGGHSDVAGLRAALAGLLCAVAACSSLLGGLIQINPIWEWGPYETYLSTNGAQPDWYLGWLIGALRLMVGFEPHIGGYTLVPNPFWGGVLFPLLVFGALLGWPALERRITGDHAPARAARPPAGQPVAHGRRDGASSPGCGSRSSRGPPTASSSRSGISYTGQIWFFRVFAWVAPFVVYRVTRRICEELRDREVHPLRSWQGRLVRRTAAGGFEALAPASREGRPRAPRPRRGARHLVTWPPVRPASR